MRWLLVLLLAAVTAHATDVPPDAEAERLRAAEAAIRAGASTPRPVTRARAVERPAGTAAGADGFFPLKREVARDFPLPPRSETAASPGSAVRSLAATPAPAPAATPPAPDADAQNTAAGLEAIQAFRRSHGVHEGPRPR